jgi:hypothetical protein
MSTLVFSLGSELRNHWRLAIHYLFHMREEKPGGRGTDVQRVIDRVLEPCRGLG